MIRSRTPLVIVLVLIFVGALGLAWWQHSALVAVRAELRAANERYAELQRKPAAPPQRPPTVALAESRPEPSGGPPPLPGPEEDGRRGRPDRFMRTMAELSSDPEVAPLLLNQRKRGVAARYAALIAQLGLPPAQVEQLKTLLAEKQLSRSEAQMLARSQGLDRGEAMEMAKLADAESDAAIRTMLGDAGFAQLQDYDRTYAQRTSVNSLAERLEYAGASLPTAQREQLIRILAANTAAGSDVLGGESGGWGVGLGGPGERMRSFSASAATTEARLAAKAAGDAAVLRQASAILSAPQLAELRQMQQEESERLLLGALTARRLHRARE